MNEWPLQSPARSGNAGERRKMADAELKIKTIEEQILLLKK
jgi:hypothetical protein